MRRDGHHLSLHAFTFAALFFGSIVVSGTGLHAQEPPERASALETGKFRLHKFAQAIGDEQYSIRRDGASLLLSTQFGFTDRGSRVPLSATLRMQPDLTPQHFSLKGKTSRLSQIDTEITVEGTQTNIRQGQNTRTAETLPHDFTLSGYAPVSVQMLLMRYWMQHGRPSILNTLPSGQVHIERRGVDTVEVDGKPVTLERYGLTGVIWGRETLWMTRARQLVALVCCDAEFDHFEAIAEGYEAALPRFIARAAQDNIAALTQVTRRLSPPRQGALVLRGGTLIDGKGGPPIPNVTLVVEGDRITHIGPADQIAVPRHATLIDARGKYILPGLWDMHAHYEQVEWGPIYLAAGVTTVRDCGNEFDYITAVRDVLRSGRGIGPQLILAGLVDGDSESSLGIVRINTPEQAHSVIQRYKEAGFAQIKIYSSIKPALVPVICEEAHRLGMSVTGHVPDGMDALQGVEAGMDQINHLQYLARLMGLRSSPGPNGPALSVDLNAPTAQKTLRTLQERHTVIDPTMAIYELSSYDGSPAAKEMEPDLDRVAPELAGPLHSAPLTAAQAAGARAGIAALLSIVGALHRAGIPIVAGTDQAVPGHSLHRELELYVQAGFTPMEAIQAATLVPARALHMENEVGTVEVGKRADLILLTANPLESIRNIRTVQSVMTGGKLYECAPLWKSVGFQP